jgi:hypothetical protein
MANYFLKQKQLQSQNVKLKFTGAERATVQARVGLGCVKDGWSCVLGYTGFFSYTERQFDVTVCFSMVGGSPPVVLNSPFVEVFFVTFSINLNRNW